MNKEMHTRAVAGVCRAVRREEMSARAGKSVPGKNGTGAMPRTTGTLGVCVIDLVHFILRTQSGLNWNSDIKEFFQQPPNFAHIIFFSCSCHNCS